MKNILSKVAILSRRHFASDSRPFKVLGIQQIAIGSTDKKVVPII